MPSDGSARQITEGLLVELTGREPGTRYPAAARLGADLGLDSLRLLFLLTRIHEETGAPPPGAAGGAMPRTAGDVEQLVARCLAAAGREPAMAADPAGASEPALEDRLAALVHELAGGRLPEPVDASTPLASLGLDSRTLVALYALVEQRFGVEFDLDTPSSCFVSIAGMADHLRSAPATAAGTLRGEA